MWRAGLALTLAAVTATVETPVPELLARPPHASVGGLVRDEAGRPIAGATVAVTVPPMDGPSWSENLGSAATTSDAGGRFRFDDLEIGGHRVGAAAPDFLDAPGRIVRVEPGGSELVLTLSRGATLRGIVTDEAGPVVGAEVAAVNRSISRIADRISRAKLENPATQILPVRAFATGTDGRFAITGLEPDAWYDVSVSAAWHESGSGGGRPSEGPLALTLRATGVITGELLGDVRGDVTCTRSEDEPPDRYVHVVSEDMRFEATEVLPGTYTCVARCFDGRIRIGGVGDRPAVAMTEQRGIVVQAGRATVIRLRLTMPPMIHVHVVDAETGSPLEGAEVSIGEWTDRTDVRGDASLPSFAVSEDGAGDDPSASEERRTLRVSERERDTVEVPVSEDDPIVIRMTRTPLIEVTGVVVTDAGPVEGATIATTGGTPVLSDAAGRFTLRQLHSWDEIVGSKDIDGVPWTGHLGVSSALAGGPESIMTLEPPEPLGELVVHLTTKEGPLEGAHVQAHGYAARGAVGMTDATGRWRALLEDHGGYELTVDGAVVRRHVRVDAGRRTELTLTLAEPWWVQGTIRSHGSVNGADVRVDTMDDDPLFEDRAHADGSFRIGPVPGWIESVVVSVSVGPGVRHARVTRVTRGDPPVVIDLRTVAVEGRIVSPRGPVAGAAVSLSSASHLDSKGAPTDQAGRFRIEDVLSGETWLVNVTSDDGYATSSFVAPDEGVVDLGDIAVSRATITGRVLTPLEDSSFELRLSTPGGQQVGPWMQDIEPGPDGSFTFDTPAGPLLFSAWLDDDEHALLLGRIEPGAPLLLAFAPAASVEVAVTGSDGFPRSAMVKLGECNGMPWGHPLWPRSWYSRTPVELIGLPAGHVVLDITSNGQSKLLALELSPGEAVHREVTLP